MNEIKIAKLISGETIIGTYSNDNKEFIEDAHILMLAQQKDGSVGVSIVPYMVPFEREGSIINSNFIICEIDCPEELQNEYISVKSNIIIPSSKIKM